MSSTDNDWTDMTKMDEHNILAEILQRVKNLEGRVSFIEQKILLKSPSQINLGDELTDDKTKISPLQNHLAEQVNSIVGLQEALTWKQRPLRIVWALLLCLGTIGTIYYIYTTTAEYLEDPTATTVRLENQENYPYPPFVLCPPTWLDAGKATAMGLSSDALQYSLGYFDSMGLPPTNTTAAQQEFQHFFEKQNYTCLDDYFKALAVDLTVYDNAVDNDNSTTSSSYCDGCNKTLNAEKVFTFLGVCYAYQLEPLDSKGRGWVSWQTTRSITARVADKTEKVLEHGANWQLYFTLDLNLVQPAILPSTVFPGTFNLIKFNSQKIIAMHTDKNPCLTEDKLEEGYSAETCMARCMNENAFETLRCRLLPWSTGAIRKPFEYCNSFDLDGGVNKSISLTEAMRIVETGNTSSCYDKCRLPCERTIHDATFLFHGPVNADLYASVNLTRSLNMTFVDLAFTSASLYQGGVLTIREFSTFSFSTLVGNVGGTLGLFVGCTILTLAQIVLSLVSYIFGARAKVDAS